MPTLVVVLRDVSPAGNPVTSREYTIGGTLGDQVIVTYDARIVTNHAALQTAFSTFAAAVAAACPAP